MKEIEGIEFIKKNNYAVCHILKFSDELQQLIKKQLVFICYGAVNANSKRKMYSYNSTLKEFLKRYDEKSNNIQKGMIGELLVHVILNEFFMDFEIVSPFFNMEERSIKKGFDIVLTHREDNLIWITEVKSGEIHINKDINGTIVDLLNTAKNDLYSRLNGENESLWLNAINGAKVAMETNNDLKDAVIDILEQYGDDSIDNKIDSKNMNVFLTGVLFADLHNCIDESRVKKKYNSILDENKFKDIFVLSIQKKTYNRVYEFLKSEVE